MAVGRHVVSRNSIYSIWHRSQTFIFFHAPCSPHVSYFRIFYDKLPTERLKPTVRLRATHSAFAMQLKNHHYWHIAPDVTKWWSLATSSLFSIWVYYIDTHLGFIHCMCRLATFTRWLWPVIKCYETTSHVYYLV